MTLRRSGCLYDSNAGNFADCVHFKIKARDSFRAISLGI